MRIQNNKVKKIEFLDIKITYQKINNFNKLMMILN
jgi:hypothetical protein